MLLKLLSLFSVATLASASFSPEPALSPPVSPQACVGCIGAGGSSSASGGSCGGAVSVSVSVTKGQCDWMLKTDPQIVTCEQRTACSVIIDRTWSGLTPNSQLEFCIELPSLGETLCLHPKPRVGSTGSGSDSRSSAELACSDTSTRNYSISSPSCGLTASAEARCSGCNENE